MVVGENEVLLKSQEETRDQTLQGHKRNAVFYNGFKRNFTTRKITFSHKKIEMQKKLRF